MSNNDFNWTSDQLYMQWWIHDFFERGSDTSMRIIKVFALRKCAQNKNL